MVVVEASRPTPGFVTIREPAAGLHPVAVPADLSCVPRDSSARTSRGSLIKRARGRESPWRVTSWRRRGAVQGGAGRRLPVGLGAEPFSEGRPLGAVTRRRGGRKRALGLLVRRIESAPVLGPGLVRAAEPLQQVGPSWRGTRGSRSRAGLTRATPRPGRHLGAAVGGARHHRGRRQPSSATLRGGRGPAQNGGSAGVHPPRPRACRTTVFGTGLECLAPPLCAARRAASAGGPAGGPGRPAAPPPVSTLASRRESLRASRQQWASAPAGGAGAGHRRTRPRGTPWRSPGGQPPRLRSSVPLARRLARGGAGEDDSRRSAGFGAGRLSCPSAPSSAGARPAQLGLGGQGRCRRTRSRPVAPVVISQAPVAGDVVAPPRSSATAKASAAASSAASTSPRRPPARRDPARRSRKTRSRGSRGSGPSVTSSRPSPGAVRHQ